MWLVSCSITVLVSIMIPIVCIKISKCLIWFGRFYPFENFKNENRIKIVPEPVSILNRFVSSDAWFQLVDCVKCHFSNSHFLLDRYVFKHSSYV